MTWNLDPVFARSWAALRLLARLVAHPRRLFMDGVCAQEASWNVLLPVANGLLAAMGGWSFSADGARMSRMEFHGLRKEVLHLVGSLLRVAQVASIEPCFSHGALV